MASLYLVRSQDTTLNGAGTFVIVVCLICDIRLQEAGELIRIAEASHVERKAETVSGCQSIWRRFSQEFEAMYACPFEERSYSGSCPRICVVI